MKTDIAQSCNYPNKVLHFNALIDLEDSGTIGEEEEGGGGEE
jgi:hypothetical protein